MPKGKTNKRARVVEEDEASSADEVVAKPNKKSTKKAKVAAAGEAATDADGNIYWALSNNRRVNLSEFKGRLFVNIREYFFDQAGEARPGKKGISLTLEQYNALLKVMPEINSELNERGHETTEIPLSAPAAPADDDDVDSSPPASASKKNKNREKTKSKPKPKKSNIDTTSDEDQDESE